MRLASMTEYRRFKQELLSSLDAANAARCAAVGNTVSMLPMYTLASGTDSSNTHNGSTMRSRRRYSRSRPSVPQALPTFSDYEWMDGEVFGVYVEPHQLMITKVIKS